MKIQQLRYVREAVRRDFNLTVFNVSRSLGRRRRDAVFGGGGGLVGRARAYWPLRLPAR
jgi:hypothetical protein